jgi:predicted RecB family nuclease
MQLSAGVLTLSPTDLSGFLGCRHRAGLDLAAALGLLPKPHWTDPFAAMLRERGEAHERQFVESLAARGLRVRDLRGTPDAASATVEAMREGIAVIVQARLDDGRWTGYADVLRRVDAPSDLGTFSYEVWDTKLARETRAGTILQLSAYTDLVSRIQGRTPEHFHVVTPDPVTPVHSYRTDEYAAYYRLVRAQLEAAVTDGPDNLQLRNYPEPVEHCDVCRWFPRCNARRRADDHLSFVADASRLHRRELEANGITTLAMAAAMPLPIPFDPVRGSRAVYERIRDQARLQEQRRTTGELLFELLPIEEGDGLCRLPEPTAGDLFLDLEGDPYAREGGREYLFGLVRRQVDGTLGYRSWWAYHDGEERAAFEELVDIITCGWTAHAGMHVYHFGHYEVSALKRLMGRYATRESEIDRLLRGKRFVDLFPIVKQSLRAGVESYSIKKLEPLYRFARAVSLDEAGRHKQVLELALEGGAVETIPPEARTAVEGYNADDCRSTSALRDWLEARRRALEEAGTEVPRPDLIAGDASENITALQEQIEGVRARLLADIPRDETARDEEQRARWLLAWMLDWHRREYRAQWWEYHRLRELPEDDLLDEPKAVAGLRFCAEVGAIKRSTVFRYAYPEQSIEVRIGAKLKLQDETNAGTLEAIDRTLRTIDIRQGPSKAHLRPAAVFDCDPISPDAMQQSILRIAQDVADHGLAGEAAASGCGIDLMMRRTPRLMSGGFEPRADESASDFAVRIATELDATVLPIQGPPGAGKTYTGARMICALVHAGRRVGVTAVSHKVIRNLLDAVEEQAAELGLRVTIAHKTDGKDFDDSNIVEVRDPKAALELQSSGEAQVLGGTPWLWARPDAAGALDVLFVDEAGQMSLANALAICPAARSVVLLGDPQQLEQPQKASHPDGTDISALAHVLGDHKTIPADRGIFLPFTWRLAPAICTFTSELFYESRLNPKAGLERQRLVGVDTFDGAGLWLHPVTHDGSQNWSPEEVDAVEALVVELTSAGASWRDEDDLAHPLGGRDILVVAPYNAQVNRLAERLRPFGVRVGTVDKFQGQEAPVVIYSMATSRAEDAPRGMEFLYSLNRLNVGTSRARCAVILVASPRLFEPDTRTPRQMQLANAMCRYLELAAGRGDSAAGR